MIRSPLVGHFSIRILTSITKLFLPAQSEITENYIRKIKLPPSLKMGWWRSWLARRSIRLNMGGKLTSHFLPMVMQFFGKHGEYRVLIKVSSSLE